MENKKRRLIISATIFSLLIAFSLIVVFLKISKTRQPGQFAVTGPNEAYFELSTDADLNSISADDEITVDVYLTTSGEPFNLAISEIASSNLESYYYR